MNTNKLSANQPKNSNSFSRDIREIYQTKKSRSMPISDLYRTFDASKAQRMSDCATTLLLNVHKDGARSFAGAMHCYLRLCPICAWRRVRQIGGRLMTMLAEPEFAGKKFLLATLTVKNCVGGELKATIDKMQKAFAKLTNKDSVLRQSWLGIFRALEITYNAKENTYHPHFHLLIAVDKKYFRRNNPRYITTEKLSALFAKKMGLDYLPNCDIQAVKSRTGTMREAVAEAGKYTVKDADIANAEVLELFDRVLFKRRLTSFVGLFADVHKRLFGTDAEEDDDESDGISDEELAVNPILYYEIMRWSFGAKIYELVRTQTIKESERDYFRKVG